MDRPHHIPMIAVETQLPPPQGTVTGLVDLAAIRLGGMVVDTNDDFFGAADRLLDPVPPAFDPLAYTHRGKLMDGWETRRRRSDGEDWCVVRLGVAGTIGAVIVDTTHFKGNAPSSVVLLGTTHEGTLPPPDADWSVLLPDTALRGDESQRFEVDSDRRVTHVRLVIRPDGGVARLRVLGRPSVDLHRVVDGAGRLDLAAMINGGRAAACSDAFFSAPSNLLMVGDSRDMGDGWETRRRRDDGHDWAVIELATTGTLGRVELDTTHYKGNYPHRVRIETADAPDTPVDRITPEQWVVAVADRPVEPHWRHVFPIAEQRAASHLRLSIVPDGGVARLRAYGQVTDEGWRRHGVRLLDAMSVRDAEEVLLACCGSTAWATEMVRRRPFRRPHQLLDDAASVWEALDVGDQREAFAAHPRIGERSESAWSSREQAGAEGADPEVLSALREGNIAYEERFGHVFLIRAAGRTARDMLAALEQRLGHDPETEHEVAAGQQLEILRLRLERWLLEGEHG